MLPPLALALEVEAGRGGGGNDWAAYSEARAALSGAPLAPSDNALRRDAPGGASRPGGGGAKATCLAGVGAGMERTDVAGDGKGSGTAPAMEWTDVVGEGKGTPSGTTAAGGGGARNGCCRANAEAAAVCGCCSLVARGRCCREADRGMGAGPGAAVGAWRTAALQLW